MSSVAAIRRKQVENVGSTARDWCMLERNILSHVKFTLLLSLLSASVLLHTRLSASPDDDTQSRPIHQSVVIAIASVLAASALSALAAGTWEYWSSDRDMRIRRAFLTASKSHIAVLSTVSGIVFVLCIVFLADNSIA